MRLATLISAVGTGWFDAGPLSVSTTVAVLAGLLSLTALLALLILRMTFMQRQKLAQADQALRQQTAAMQAMLDAIPFPILLKDTTATYRMLNAACHRRLDRKSVV